LNISAKARELRVYDYLGGLIQVQKLSWPLFGAYSYSGHRALLHEVLVEHAKSLGIEIRMGEQVVEYWEDEANGKAGVKIHTGETFDADVVVAADGVKSLARKFVIVSLSFNLPVTLAVNIDQGVLRQPKTFWLRYLPSMVRC
jgi:2-polyprenyl-6-methoxyphenol hydroxylase-like FAD-dependent oxidoreductase